MKASSNGSAKRERRRFSGQQKVSIVKQHLVDGVVVSDQCDKHQILPTQFYQWQQNEKMRPPRSKNNRRG